MEKAGAKCIGFFFVTESEKTMTEQWEIFATEYARTGNATQSAIVAGYSETSAYNQGYRLMKNDEVVKRIAEIQHQMSQELRDKMSAKASSAFEVLEQIMRNPDAKDADRIKCAVEVLDRAGYVAEKKVEVSASKKDMDKADEIMLQFGMLDV